MKTNVGMTDRIIRVLLGIILIAVGLLSIQGAGGTILAIVGLVLLLTSVLGFCPIYKLLKFSTNK